MTFIRLRAQQMDAWSGNQRWPIEREEKMADYGMLERKTAKTQTVL